ncbi:hypothetical protein BDR22DRAFT_887251 [Usnea florida]
MQLIQIPQSLWSLWNYYWANDLVAMSMAIFCAQQISNIVRRLYCHCVGGTSMTITFSGFFGMLEILVKETRWSRALLNLEYAVQFPILTAFHPLVSRLNINDWTSFPGLPRLIGQVLVFLAIDYISLKFFSRCYQDIFEDDDSNDNVLLNDTSPALEVATDFSASGTTLLLAITLIELSSRLRYFTGGLHFTAILCWLLIRTETDT